MKIVHDAVADFLQQDVFIRHGSPQLPLSFLMARNVLGKIEDALLLVRVVCVVSHEIFLDLMSSIGFHDYTNE